MKNDAQEFLARVIPATGNFCVLAIQGGRGMYHVAVPIAGGFGPAEVLIDKAVREKNNIYHALAAYTVADPREYRTGGKWLSAKRDRANVHSIKVLALDCDVTRPGDGKDTSKVFATQQDAVKWVLVDFCQTARIPPPNMAVHSGYGLHFYWVMQDAMTVQQWQPLADAMRVAMIQHGFTGDTAITIDAARILRPPTSVNMKSGQAVSVYILDKFTQPDYKNADMTTALTPYMVAGASTSTGTYGAGATVSTLGPRPGFATVVNPLNASASANIDRRKWQFSEIVTQCKQLALSVQTGGKGERRDHWFLRNLTLLAHCVDGDDYPHIISQGDHRYDAANVDAYYQLAKRDVDGGQGAPLCVSFDKDRPGVCTTCTHLGKINSPVTLSVDQYALPGGYRRHMGRIERRDGEGDDIEWIPIILGDVREPRLVKNPTGGLRLEFIYTFNSKTHHIGVDGGDMGQTKQQLVPLFEHQGITIKPDATKHMADFIVAWINHLRQHNASLVERVETFGWNANKVTGAVTGVSVAGVHYRNDGTSYPVTGGDQNIVKAYMPAGSLAQWRKAAAWFEGAGVHPDLQLFFALSFGAPLIGVFNDVVGMSWNLFTPHGGAGKTSAMRVAQAIWGTIAFIQSETDTPNSVASTMSQVHILPRFWDEMRVDEKEEKNFVSLIYNIAQGREKMRLSQNAELKEVRNWRTMLVMASNRALSDIIMAHAGHTNAGALRMMEVQLSSVPLMPNPQAGRDIALCYTNHGHAGVEFIKYVVANMALIQKTMAGIQVMYNAKLKAGADDRLLITGMTCAMTGAAIAKQLGLFDFDLNGVDAVMCGAFHEMRGSRASQLPMITSTGAYNVPEIVMGFCDKHVDKRAYTREILPPGRKDVAVLAELPRHQIIYYQVGHNDRRLLVSIEFLNAYLIERGFPWKIVDDLVNNHGAKRVKLTLGAGTLIPQHRKLVLDIPLNPPFDAVLNSQYDAAIATTPTQPAAPRGVTGNQVKETQ